MRTSFVLVGLVVLLVGAAVLYFGESTPINGTSTSTTSTTATLVPTTNRVIGANGLWSSGGVNVLSGEALSGTFTISNYSSSKGPVFFYIMNETQFSAWGGCAPCASPSLKNFTAPSTGTYSFTWTAPTTGSVLFIFDDSAYSAAAQASSSVTGQYSATNVVATTSPNWNVIYGGAAVAAVGAIIMAAGVLMGGRKPAMAPATTP